MSNLVLDLWILPKQPEFTLQQTSANRGHTRQLLTRRIVEAKLEFHSQYWGKYINFKITQIMLEPSFDHLYATYSYMSYKWVDEFLTNCKCRWSYSPKFALQQSIVNNDKNQLEIKQNIFHQIYWHTTITL